MADVVGLIEQAERLPGAAAAELYRTWLAAEPDHPLAYAVAFNLSVVLGDLGRVEEAAALLERALAQTPDFLPAYINLGRTHERRGDAPAAVTAWSALADRLAAVTGSAVAHKTMALNQIARVLEANHQDASAEAMLRQSLELDPRQREVVQHLVALRQRQCAWPAAQPSERVDRRRLVEAMSPLSMAAFADDPMLQLASAHAYSRHDVGRPPVLLDARGAPEPKRLRIGYLSSDLREHAVGYLTAELFERHDRGAVEVFAYYCGQPGEDPLQARIKAAVEHWVDLDGLDDLAAAQRIAADGIHLLVDLNGYTRDARVKMLAMRPAPVIVNWLGFPGSMGSPHHHYLIADPTIVPAADERFYSERVKRLACYQPTDRRRKLAARRPSRAEAGLPEAAVVFCCFNGLHKLNRPTVERWLATLARVPDSVLWLLAGNEGAHERLRAMAAERGVAPERLVFAGKLANGEHLARYPLADLFLDTWPYGAHTTASDALWMGVPVLTFPGRSFAARVCTSLVRAAGLPELAVDGPDAFVETAVALGTDRARLAALRDRLAANRDTCRLFDTAALAAELEGLYREMWAEYQAGDLPRPDLRNLDVYLEVAAGEELEALQPDEAWWRERLAAYDAWRPLEADRRMWRGRG